jgi:hypothetical protein
LKNFHAALKKSTITTNLVISLAGFGGYKTFMFPNGDPLHYNDLTQWLYKEIKYKSVLLYGDFRGAASMFEFMPRGVVGIASEENTAQICYASDTPDDCKGTVFGQLWVESYG